MGARWGTRTCAFAAPGTRATRGSRPGRTPTASPRCSSTGPPVNVVVPALPVRRAPQPDPVRRDKAVDLGTLQAPALADQLALDRMLGDLQACALRVTTGAQQVRLGLVVAASGRVEAALPPDTPAGRCLAAAHRGRAPGAARPGCCAWTTRCPRPTRRTWRCRWTRRWTRRGPGVGAGGRALGARSRLPPSAPGGELAVAGAARRDRRGLPTGSAAVRRPAPSGARACVRRAFQGLRLDEASPAEAAGIARLRAGRRPPMWSRPRSPR